MAQTTFVDVLCHGAAHRPAVSGPDAPTLDYVTFCNAADAIAAALVVRGIAPGDRVAAAFPDGVAYLAAFAGTALARAAFVPLAEDDDLEERFGPVAPRLLLGGEFVPQAVRVAAHAAGIPLATLTFDANGAVLIDGAEVYEAHGARVVPDDVAFVASDGTEVTQAALVDAVREHAALRLATVQMASPLSALPGLTAALAVLAAGGHLIVGDGARRREPLLLGN